MSHSIPVIYLVCERYEMPESLVGWSDSQDVITRVLQEKPTYAMHLATWQNWWQVQAIAEVRDRMNLPGLEFVDAEIACRTSHEAAESIKSLSCVIEYYREFGQLSENSEEPIEDNIDCDPEGGPGKFLFSHERVLRKCMERDFFSAATMTIPPATVPTIDVSRPIFFFSIAALRLEPKG